MNEKQKWESKSEAEKREMVISSLLREDYDEDLLDETLDLMVENEIDFFNAEMVRWIETNSNRIKKSLDDFNARMAGYFK